jgi:hypothetical protein
VITLGENTVMSNSATVERPDPMSKDLIEEMSTEAFERAIDDFITREQTGVLRSPFFQALALIDQQREKQAVGRVIYLQARVVGDRLVFAPTEPESPVTVEDNEIMLEDGRRIVLELVSDQSVTP